MTTAIAHSEVIDLRDLAELALEQGDIYSNPEESEADRETATETLEALIAMLRALGEYIEFINDELVVEDIAEALIRISDNSTPSMIQEDAFTDEMQSECEEFYPEIGNLPAWVFIDWNRTAQALKQDYSAVTLDGEVYLVRKA